MFTYLILLLLTCCELSHCSQGPGNPEGWCCLLSVTGAWKPLSISVSYSSSASVLISPSFPFAVNVPAEVPLSRLYWLSYLCMQRMCLYSSRVISPLSHLYCKEILIHTCRLPATFDWFPIHQDVSPLNLKKVILKNPSSTSLVSGIITHGNLPSMFLNWAEALPYIWDMNLSQIQNALHSIQKVAGHVGFL